MDYVELYNKAKELTNNEAKHGNYAISPLLLSSKLELDKDQYIDFRKNHEPFDQLCRKLELACEAELIQSLMYSKNDNVKIFLLKSIFGYKDENISEQVFDETNLKKISEYANKKAKA